MDLKNATAVCLIAFFASTLVVLIARSLDLQAAARLEPQLAEIAKELKAIRGSGALAAESATGTGNEATVDNGLMVYYFHSNTRCPTCRAIESQSYATLTSEFASPLDKGFITWKTVNYEEAANADLATQFEVQMPVIVLAQMSDGRTEQWKRLDQVWALVGDHEAFTKYVADEIQKMLPKADETLVTEDAKPTGTSPSNAPAPLIPQPSDIPTDPIPLPSPETTTPPPLPQ